MSVDLFIWSKNKLQSDNRLLLDYGYQDKGDFYERRDESDTWLVHISCEAVSSEHQENGISELAKKFVLEVNYYTEINFMGDIPDDVIEGTLFHKLAAELGGILDDPNSGTFQDENGREIFSYIEEYDDANISGWQNQASTDKPKTKEQIKRNYIFNFVMLGVLSVGMLTLAVIFSSIRPDGQAVFSKIPAIVSCSVVSCICAGFLIFLAFRYKKFNKENGAIMTIQSENENDFKADSRDLDDEKYERLHAEAAAYDYDANKRRFIFQDEKSDKFWHVNRIGEYYYVHYGKNGTFGRIEVKETESEEVCKKFVEKTIVEKLEKGYSEIKDLIANDEFEQAKQGCRPALDSMYVMFCEDEPLIYIAAIKTACEQFCDVMRLAAGNKEKILNAVKAVVLCLNQYAEDPGLIETDEREILGPWTDEVAALAGYEDPDDLAGEWREW